MNMIELEERIAEMDADLEVAGGDHG